MLSRICRYVTGAVTWIEGLIRVVLTHFRGRHVLLLQGPMGPFFWRLRKDLVDAGAHVKKINFCAGDALFYPFHAVAYHGRLADWPWYLDHFAEREHIDTIMLFGDCRPYHAAAREVAKRRGCELFVFEEGYLRPDCITLERGGVNRHSPMSRDPLAYAAAPDADREPRSVGKSFGWAAFYACCYGLANFLSGARFPHYQHHRPMNPLIEPLLWLRGWVRREWYLWREAKLLGRFKGELDGRYFLVPLQVHNDAQITAHSAIGSVEEFIARVAGSFAVHAPAGQALVIKHHPMDRPYRDYGHLVARIARQYGLEGRLFYVHDLHLPTMLQHARGTVVVNSTVGLSSIYHGTPVIALGDPVYNVRGLSFQGTLNRFWSNPGEIDREFYLRFRNWLLAHNQANGNFYRRLRGTGNACGVVWPSRLAERAHAPVVDRRPLPVFGALAFAPGRVHQSRAA